MTSIAAGLAAAGFPAGDRHDRPSSTITFPDGARFRFEIPSVEGVDPLAAVIEEAEHWGVPIHRVSQGSGISMLSDSELDEMARMAAEQRMEVSLFARPNASWHLSAASKSPGGGHIAPTAHGMDQVTQALEETQRAVAHGYRSVLIADVGTLFAFGRLRAEGVLPPDVQAKVSVSLPVSNAATARLVADLGANTLNIPTDLDLGQIAAIRAAVELPLDIYMEAPDSLGGFVRSYEIAEIIRVASPVYLKFGLRNAPDIYPVGRHLRQLAADLARERVHRAFLGFEAIRRALPDEDTSELGARGLAVPLARELDSHR
jgi:hypothetical protein